MEAELTEKAEIHVACDTGIFREVLHKNAPWLEDFKAMTKSGVIFSFADHALAEIIKQLEEGGLLSRSTWRRSRPARLQLPRDSFGSGKAAARTMVSIQTRLSGA